LADLAFALASNSHGFITLALDVSVSFLKAARVGEKIEAEAKEEHLGKSTAVYIMTVKNEKGEKSPS